MTLLYKIGFLFGLFGFAAFSGFFYGRSYEREANLRQAVYAYQLASDIKNEIDFYNDYALCLAISGLSKLNGKNDQCAIFLHGVDEAAGDK